jgi:hypothetical protein
VELGLLAPDFCSLFDPRVQLLRGSALGGLFNQLGDDLRI